MGAGTLSRAIFPRGNSDGVILMKVEIVLFICLFISGIILRFFLRAGIKGKVWKKYAKGSFMRKWFLWDFRKTISNKVALWIYMIAIIIGSFAFICAMVAYFCGFELLQIVSFIILTVIAFLLFDTLEVVMFLGTEKKGRELITARNFIYIVIAVGITTFVCVILLYGMVHHFIA